jgi:hypothetical protein
MTKGRGTCGHIADGRRARPPPHIIRDLTDANSCNVHPFPPPRSPKPSSRNVLARPLVLDMRAASGWSGNREIITTLERMTYHGERTRAYGVPCFHPCHTADHPSLRSTCIYKLYLPLFLLRTIFSLYLSRTFSVSVSWSLPVPSTPFAGEKSKEHFDVAHPSCGSRPPAQGSMSLLLGCA